MKSYKIAICPKSIFNDKDLRKLVKKNFKNTIFNKTNGRLKEKNLCDFLKDADIAIVGLEILDKELLQKLPKLKAVVKYGVGLDGIDSQELRKRGIAFKYQKGVNKNSVSELAICFILMASRRLRANFNNLCRNDWKQIKGFEIKGKKIGIIGLGNIGFLVAKKLKAFGCKILVNDILDKNKICKTNNFVQTNLTNIKKKCDIISIHTPLTKKTKGLVNRNFLDKLKKDAILVNTARGEIINFKDLYIFLKKNKKFNFVTDVFDKEPWIKNKLIDLENFFATPHIGGSTRESTFLMTNAAITKTKEYLKKNANT